MDVSSLIIKLSRWHLPCDYLTVAIGREVQQVVPGFISTELDARLSFDTEKNRC